MIKVAKDLIIRSSSAEFLIFERQSHDKGIQVRFEDGDLWLTQKSISELFNTTRNNVKLYCVSGMKFSFHLKAKEYFVHKYYGNDIEVISTRIKNRCNKNN